MYCRVCQDNDPCEALWLAAKKGHPNCMKRAKSQLSLLPKKIANAALWDAARGGHIDCMELAYKWGATDINFALLLAAGRGNVYCLKLTKKWGADKFEAPFIWPRSEIA